MGRPKKTWRRTVEDEVKAAGWTWAQLKRTARNRVRWRGVVAVLCSPRSQEESVKVQAEEGLLARGNTNAEQAARDGTIGDLRGTASFITTTAWSPSVVTGE